MAFISYEYVIPILIVLLYFLYYKKFKFYEYIETLEDSIKNKLPRGKCPPSYPNGWYRLCRTSELNVGYGLLIKCRDVKEIKLCGRHIAYYRGSDNVAYAVAAYCPHMGANLGVGGKVKHGHCIE